MSHRLLAPALLVALWSVPASADDSRKRPTDEARGKELYERHCVACHGATARGDGPATSALVVPIPDLAGQVQADKPTVDLVVYGRGAMPAYEASFDADDAKRVLKYMATVHEAKPAAEKPAAPAPQTPEGPEGPEGGEPAVEGEGGGPG